MYSIGRGLGTPLKVDKKTFDKEIGLFARILIDIDLARQVPERMLIQRKDLEFFIFGEIENCPSFCNLCGAIGHQNNECSSKRREDDKAGRQDRLPKNKEGGLLSATGQGSSSKNQRVHTPTVSIKEIQQPTGVNDNQGIGAANLLPDI